ncbi:MAG: AEC family transporter, partial [Pseudomonadota bacterium]|nr:AEC family transporter [Pseudomonadota bacterium]
GRLPETAAAAHNAFVVKALNAFIINISLPALILLLVPGLHWDRSLIYSILMPWIMFIGGLGFFWCAGKLACLPAQTIGCLMLTGSLANTSFVGLPMIEAYYGPQGRGVGILIDQFGTYAVLSSLGIVVAAAYSSHRVTWAMVCKKVLLFRPFQALLIALVLMPQEYPGWLESTLRFLGSLLAPLAFVSVGMQLRLSSLRGRIAVLSLGLGFKLLLAPALLMLLLVHGLGSEGEVTRITLFEAAMPPMIGAAIVAGEHDLDRELVALMVGVGIPLSFVTLHLWSYVLNAAVQG